MVWCGLEDEVMADGSPLGDSGSAAAAAGDTVRLAAIVTSTATYRFI
jgi:hypothetical protein